MMRKISGVILCCLLFACGEADTVPDGLIGKQKMAAILFDMNLADTYGREPMDTVPLTEALRESNVKTYYAQVLQLHKVSSAEFMKSYRFYESHPTRLQEVFNMMGDLVNVYKTEVDSLDRVKTNQLNRIDPVKKDTTRWPMKDIRKMILP